MANPIRTGVEQTVLADSDGRKHTPHRMDEVAKRLREALPGIQERRARDPFGWTQEIV
jgi:hypothetical protein